MNFSLKRKSTVAKIISLLMILMMVLSACGNNGGSGKKLETAGDIKSYFEKKGYTIIDKTSEVASITDTMEPGVKKDRQSIKLYISVKKEKPNANFEIMLADNPALLKKVAFTFQEGVMGNKADYSQLEERYKEENVEFSLPAEKGNYTLIENGKVFLHGLMEHGDEGEKELDEIMKVLDLKFKNLDI